MKRKYIILSLISILFLLALTAASATDNNTEMQSVDDDSSLNIEVNDKLESSSSYYSTDDASESADDYYYDDDYFYDDEDDYWHANIEAKNINMEYSQFNDFYVKIKDVDGEYLDYLDDVRVEYDNDPEFDIYNYEIRNNKYYIYCDLEVGNHTAKITLEDDLFYADPVTINITITKGDVKLIPYEWTTTTNEYATLKVRIKETQTNEPIIADGTVTFKVNGKSYTVDVDENGYAIKKIKLPEAKTYTYTASFSSKNYKSKNTTSKLYIKKAKKNYTFKVGKYKGTITYKQYLKLLNAKNSKKSAYITVKTKYKVKIKTGTEATAKKVKKITCKSKNKNKLIKKYKANGWKVTAKKLSKKGVTYYKLTCKKTVDIIKWSKKYKNANVYMFVSYNNVQDWHANKYWVDFDTLYNYPGSYVKGFKGVGKQLYL